MEILNLKNILGSLIYSVIGLSIFALGFKVFDRITPGKLWHEIIEEHNVALAVIVGAIAIGIGLIISAAIHG